MNIKLVAGTMILAGLISSGKCQERKKEDKPNIIFIFADQYRRASLGFLNEDSVHTPNIDQLAQNGVFFSKAVSNYPLCSPYRAMLMTGKYPQSNGVLGNCNSSRTTYGNYLKKEETCFSDVLAQNGYSAGYVGKWHLDGPKPSAKGERNVWDSWCPPDRRHGFSFWYAYGAHSMHMNPYYWTTHAEENEKTFVKQWSPEHEADVIMDYIENSKGEQRPSGQPFALFWSINPPHTPFNAVPEKYKEKKMYQDVLNRENVRFVSNNDLPAGDKGVEREIHLAPEYFASINGVDEQIGRVIQKLKENNLYENTIIIFSSDHGEMLGSQGLMHKNIWFRESFEIPFIVHFPKIIKAKTDDLMISVPDFMPTLLGLMGLRDKIPEQVEGKDYSGVFFNKEIERPQMQLYFQGDASNPCNGNRGFRDKKYTFAIVKGVTGKKYYLYDDLTDPFQKENIWGKNKALDEQMSQKLDKLLRSMNDCWIND